MQLPIIVAAAAAGLHILLLQLTPSSSWHIHRTIVTLCRLSWHIFIHDLMSGKCSKEKERVKEMKKEKKLIVPIQRELPGHHGIMGRIQHELSAF